MPFKVPEPTNNLIPEGTYEVILKEGGYMDATKGRTIYMNIPMVVRNDVEQKCKNMFIWDAVWTESTQKHIDFKTSNISRAVGIPAGTEFEDLEAWGKFLKSKVLRVTIKHGEYNGQPQAQISGYAKTQHPDVKHVFQTKTDVRVNVDPADFEEIEIDDGDMPF